MRTKTAGRQHILLAEHDPLDIELTLDAFARNHFPHEIAVVSDGEQALDYLYRREKFQTRPAGIPFVCRQQDAESHRPGGGEDHYCSTLLPDKVIGHELGRLRTL